MSLKYVEVSLAQLDKSEDYIKNGTIGKIEDHVLPPFDTSVGCKELVHYKIGTFCAAKMYSSKLCKPIVLIAMGYRVPEFPQDIENDNIIVNRLSHNKGGL